VLNVTGLSFNLTYLLVQVGGGSAFLLLLLSALVCIVLGMGLPTIPTYIITSTMAAPALAVYGIPPLVAHMFVFYFGLLADLTPPVALAAFAGAGIAKADPTKTAFSAVRLALAGFLVPFIFVYDNSLMLLNTTMFGAIEITATALSGIVLLGAGAIGYFVIQANYYERVVFIAGALCLIVPGLVTDTIGLGLGVLAIGSQWIRRRNLLRAASVEA